jgi:peptidyl-prolyl cis-trans isomerase D
MITAIRRLFNSRFGAIFALIFIGLMALAFVLGDVTGSNSFGGLGGGNVAKVGDKDITLGEFTDAVDVGLRTERQQNPNLDMASFVKGGGFDAVLQQLTQIYGAVAFGEETGVAVSKRIIDAEILKMQGAKGLDGQFSQEAFQAFLAQNNMSEKSFRDRLAQSVYIEQFLTTAQSGTKVAQSYTMPYASLQLEKRSGEFALVPAQSFLPAGDPTPAILTKYYSDNSTRFTIPEQRAVSYVLFERSIVEGQAKPSAKEIADYYKENQDAYAASEVRDISLINVPTEAGAKAAIDRVNKGQPLAAVAQELGLAVSNAANVSKTAFAAQSSQTLADAVFATPKGQMAKPAKAKGVWSVAQVTDVRGVKARSLAEATQEITKLLETEKRGAVLSQYTGGIEEAFSDGQSIEQVAKAKGLKVETSPKLFATGQDPTNQAYRPIPEMSAILPAAFQLEEDGSAQLIEVVKGERFAMIAVAGMKKAAPPPLVEVRPIVLQQWKLAEGAKKAKAAAEQVRALIASGKSVAEAMASLKIKAPPSETLTGSRQELSRDGKSLPAPLLLLFSMKEGTAKTMAAPNNAGWLVVRLAKIINGDAAGNKPLVDAKTAELSTLLDQEISAQFIAAAMKEVGVKKNEGVIADFRKRLTKNDGN